MTLDKILIHFNALVGIGQRQVVLLRFKIGHRAIAKIEK
jgi:hypothetical protein